MITGRSNNPDMLYISTTDVHGGRELNISLSSEMTDTINWVKQYRKRLDMELELRTKNPALASAWDQYQVMLRIVMDDV